MYFLFWWRSSDPDKGILPKVMYFMHTLKPFIYNCYSLLLCRIFDSPGEVLFFVFFSPHSHSIINVGKTLWLPLHPVGFPCGSAGKEFACNAGDLVLIPGLGRSSGERKVISWKVMKGKSFHDCIYSAEPNGLGSGQDQRNLRIHSFDSCPRNTGQVSGLCWAWAGDVEVLILYKILSHYLAQLLLHACSAQTPTVIQFGGD